MFSTANPMWSYPSTVLPNDKVLWLSSDVATARPAVPQPWVGLRPDLHGCPHQSMNLVVSLGCRFRCKATRQLITRKTPICRWDMIERFFTVQPVPQIQHEQNSWSNINLASVVLPSSNNFSKSLFHRSLTPLGIAKHYDFLSTRGRIPRWKARSGS